jgi:hypothetical protein
LRRVVRSLPVALTFEELFFQFCLCDLNLDRFVNLLIMTALVVGVILDSGREKGVDERSFAQPRLASNL